MKTTLLCTAVALVTLPTYAATTWVGGGNTDDLFDTANYTGSAPVQSTGAAQTPLAEDLFITGASIANGAGYTVGFGRLQLGAGFAATFDNTNINATGNTGGFSGTGNDLSTNFSFVNGSIANVQFVLNAIYSIDATSSLRLRGGGNPINSGGASPVEVHLFDQGAQLILTNAANFSTNQANGNKIFAHNAAGELVSYNSDNSILTLVTAGGVTTGTANFAPIPEPATTALLALVVALATTRRRR